MNRKIGMISSVINICSVAAFALCMLTGANFLSYFVCMFIAFSFVPMMVVFCHNSQSDRKTAGYAAMIFAGMYAIIILLVYFAQVTTVRLEVLSDQVKQVLDYQNFGLFFNYDLLGYGLMALATFFAGLTIRTKNKVDRWLKLLLLIHGIFFFTCLIMPMTGAFTASQSKDMDWIGVAVLEFWCIYFIPVGVLSLLHFKNMEQQ